MPPPVSRTGWNSLERRFCHEFLLGFAYHTCRARRASVYLGHSIAVRICCSHLCLVFISPTPCSVSSNLPPYLSAIRDKYGRAHLRHSDMCRRSVLPPSVRRSSSSSPQSTLFDPPILRALRLTLIASFWEPGVKLVSCENRNHYAAFDEGTPTNGTPFQIPMFPCWSASRPLIMLHYASALFMFPCVYFLSGWVYDNKFRTRIIRRVLKSRLVATSGI